MSPSPQNPATTPPAPTITVNGSNLTLPQSVARPMTLQDVQLLQARRSELSRQLTSATQRRSEVIRSMNRSQNGREGLEARLKVLDERIVQIEKDIAQNGQLLASAPPNLVEETTPPSMIGGPGRGIDVTAVSLALVFAVGMPLTIAWSIRMLRRARVAGMFASTAAILPPAMATSRSALILFFGSTTLPPLRSRS